MISGIIKRILPNARNYLLFSKITLAPQANFSRVDKFNEFKKVLDYEIKAETQNLADLTNYEKQFKTLGWRLKKENTEVELAKRVDEYDVRLVSSIKPPTTLNQQDKEKESSEELAMQMNQVTICITKLGSSRVMAIYVIVTNNGFDISNIKFFANYEQLRERRLDFNSQYDYDGPHIETVPEQLYLNVSSFITEELKVTQDALEALTQYCLDCEQGLYINWLKDLKNVL